MTHIPVLLNEVIAYLDIKPGSKYIDATYGMGGHAKAITERGGEVLGIDRDSAVVEESKTLNPKSKIVQGNFKDLKAIAIENGFEKVDGILFDFGFGSHQLDDPERGFSFSKSGPLDMRYDRSQNLESRSKKLEGETAADVVNYYSEKDLVKIFLQYGEEKRFGKRIARAIMEARKTGSIETTDELFNLIKSALPGKFRYQAADTARRIFQALRIKVNDELANIEKALPQALQILEKGGRLVVVSFHSLEDRIVKNFMKSQARDCVCPPEFPVCRCDARASLRILTKKPITASLQETKINPRARSAKLRAAEKIRS